MRLDIFRPATLCAALAGLANAGNYIIDDSCDTAPGMLTFIQTTLNNALLMSQAAYDAATRVPMDPTVQAVLASLVNPANPVSSTPVEFATQIFGPQGINRLTNQVISTYSLGVNDVKIYCDLSRFIQREIDGEWVDTDVNRHDVEHIKCRARDILPLTSSDFALMYTTFNPPRDAFPGGPTAQGESFQQIQICPYFLSWALPLQRNNLFTASLPGTLWRKLSVGAGKLIAQNTLFSEIDGVSLFDKVLLHELTHATTAAVVTDDIQINGVDTYGWTRCTALSTSDSVTAGAAQNADTWALFGSICYLLQQGEIAGVNADGTVIKV